MAPRPIWKGQLRLSLVSIPVEIYSAVRRSARISFRQIHEPSGQPVKYEKTAAGVGPVDPDDIVKGYEVEKGEYVLIDPEEVDAIKLETKKTLELVQFVETCEIPPLYFDRPYYVVPSDDLAEDAYRVVRDALRQADRVGLGQLTMRGKEHLVAIKPCGDGLLMETLYYEEEIREADPLFSGIKDEESDDELLQVATELIERKTAPFDAAAYEDNYAAALRDLVDAKTKSKSSKRVSAEEDSAPRPSGTNVVDLMSALKKSLDAAEGGSRKSRRKPARKKSA